MTTRRIYTAMAALGLALLGLALLTGLAHSIASERHLPGIGLNHLRSVEPLLAAGDFDTALDELAAIAVIDPTNAPALEMLAGLATARGDHARAILARQQALLSRPKDPAARVALAEALLADARSRTARAGPEAARDPLQRAAREAEVAVGLDPRSAPAHRALAEALLRLGRREKAAFHRAQALRLAREAREAAPPFAAPGAGR